MKPSAGSGLRVPGYNAYD